MSIKEEKKKYDLFNTAESAALYSQHQPPLATKVVDLVVKSAPARDLFLDIGRSFFS